MFFLKKSLALVTVAVMAAAIGTGCNSSPKGENKPTTANLKIAVDGSALQSDIGSVKLTIDAAPGGGSGFPITALLTKAPAGNVWTANVSQIPATAAGIQRTFTAAAYSGPNGTGTKLYEGSTIATVTAGQTAQVTIILQELNAPVGPTNYAPAISSLSSTAAYLLPGQTGTFTVSAYDPDDAAHFNRPQFNGEPLAYQWSASCDNGTLTIAAPTAASTGFTAPSVPSAICTVAIKVSETTLANNSSVTTFFTVTVNGNFGNADIFAFPNTAPVVTVRGDLRYNFFSDVTTIPVGQQGDLFFHAVDADGDNVRFDLSGKCGTGFDAVDGQLVNGTAIAANQFSAITFTSNTPGAQNFNPTFAYPAPVSPFTDPSKSCSFKIVVSDLCTAGNCGPAGSQGFKPDGADRGGSVTGFLNATAPSQPKRAPSIVRFSVPNQSGGAVPGAQTWDPQKYVVVLPSTTYNLSVEGYDQFEAGPITISQVCNVGTAATVLFSTPNGVKSGKLDATWTSPGTLLASMSCSFTVTSVASGLATVGQVFFSGSDPCIGQANGTACDDGNACTTGTVCTAGVCGGGTTTVCTASDQCHVVGVCNPNTGVCSNPSAPDATACNADSNGCTQNDSCQAGVCTAGAAAVCNTPPGQCFSTPGACVSGGSNTFTCNYAPKASGATCSDGNGCTQTDACDGAGACVGGNPVNCAGGACTTGGTCNPATGTCQGGTNQPNGTACSDGNACTTSDTCQGGVCTPGAPFCGPGQSCDPAGPTCTDQNIVPQVAKLLELANSVGLGIDTAGNSYVTGTLVTPAKTFDGTTLLSAGGADAFIGSYAANGTKRWVVSYGDSSDQLPTNLAVADVASNRVLANGRFSGAIGPLNAGAATWDYLLFLNAGTGAVATGKSVDTGVGGAFFSVGANQNLGLFAVCGQADKLALDTSAGAPGTTWATVAGANTFGGSTDILIGLYSASGTLLWAKQIGTAAGELCNAVTIDDVGNVVAAGVYSGSGNLTLAGATPLPNPGSSFRRHLWVAKFDGTTGAGISQAAFGGGAGTHVVNGVSVDSSGNVFIAGAFTNSLPFTATSGGATACTAGSNGCFASSGGQDAYVAKLSSALAPIWMSRIGVSTGDDVARGLSIDSFGNPSIAGLLNGASSASTITPTTAATAPVTAPSITSPGGSSSSFIAKFPTSTGLFSAGAAATTGNTLASNGNRIAINAKGTGTVKDALSYNGDFSGGTLNFGGTTSPITAPSGAATFLVFGKEQ